MKTLHAHQIIHRDLKCANVFLSKNKQNAILGDMNVSKILKDDFAKTQTGTPYYASPEVWRCEKYDSKTDIWSLGCVAFELCNFKQPFQAPDIDGLFLQVQQRKIQDFDSFYSENLREVIENCLCLDPLQRPSAKELLENKIFENLNFEFEKQKNMNTRKTKKQNFINSFSTKNNYNKKAHVNKQVNIYLTPKVAKVWDRSPSKKSLIETIPGDIGFDSIARILSSLRAFCFSFSFIFPISILFKAYGLLSLVLLTLKTREKEPFPISFSTINFFSIDQLYLYISLILHRLDFKWKNFNK